MAAGLTRPSPRTLWPAAICVAATLAATLVRGAEWRIERPPSLAAEDLVVLGLALLAGLAFARLAFDIERRLPAEAPNPGGLLLIAAALVTGLVATIMLVVAPQTLSAALLEDGPAENASAALLFVGALVLLWAAWRHRGAKPLPLACLAGAALLALIGFEEVSWFQRVTGMETPDWLAGINVQREFNLHNVATGASENLYYLGAFGLCLLARYLLAPATGPLSALRPSMPVMATAALACAMTYDMWAMAHFEVLFFMALGALLALAAANRERAPAVAFIAVGVAGAMLVIQTGMLLFGGNFDRLWDATELRETVIALALFGLALQVALAAPLSLARPEP